MTYTMMWVKAEVFEQTGPLSFQVRVKMVKLYVDMLTTSVRGIAVQVLHQILTQRNPQLKMWIFL